MNDASKETAMLGYERCERLLLNADVRWFIEEALTKPRADKEKELKSLDTPREAREIAAHVREVLEQAEQFLARRRDIYSRDLPRPKK